MKDSLKKCKRCNNKFVYFNSEYCLECIDIIRKEKLVKSMQNNPEKYMYGFPKRFKKWDIEHILPKFKEIVTEHTKSQGLFITGQTGSGKTCLMCVLSKEMAKIGREIWFKNVSDLLFEIKGTFDKKGGIFNDYEMITNWAKKPFLVLGDLLLSFNLLKHFLQTIFAFTNLIPSQIGSSHISHFFVFILIHNLFNHLLCHWSYSLLHIFHNNLCLFSCFFFKM